MPWKPKQCVVVPVDFSEGSGPAVQEALDMAQAPDSVHVLHVLPDLDVVSPGVIFGNVTDESRMKAAEKYMQTFLKEGGLEGVNSTVLIGDPGTEVVRFAKKHNAELIVIPSHGYHGVKHLLLGSVAERIIRHASCTVHVLRRPDAQ
ncbi:MAG: universal stress protein [Fuerstiella sp.]